MLRESDESAAGLPLCGSCFSQQKRLFLLAVSAATSKSWLDAFGLELDDCSVVLGLVGCQLGGGGHCTALACNLFPSLVPALPLTVFLSLVF